MPEYLSPGVYVEEVETGAMTIEGVSTSTAGFLGQTERGPVEPQFVSSFADFKRQFGGLALYRRNQPLEDTNLAYAVEGFFRNGGQRCWVGRVTAAERTADLGLGAYSTPMALTADTATIDFERVVVGQAVTETVEISHAGIENDPPIEITAIDALAAGGGPSGEFDVVLPQGTPAQPTLDPAEPLEVTVSYQPGAAGTHGGTLTVEHDGADSPLRVALSGTGVAPDAAATLSIDDDAVDFGTVPLDTVRAETITLHNDGLEGADDVTVDSVSLDDGPGSATPFDVPRAGDVAGTTLGVDDRVSFDVEVDHDTAEAVEAELVVEFTIAGTTETTRLPIRGDVVDPANTIGADRKAFDFGVQVTTTTTERIVTLRNMGTPADGPVEITGVAMATGGQFDAGLVGATTPLRLESGQSVPLSITFTPTADGPHSDSVEVTYDAGAGTRVVEVSGEGDDVPGEYAVTPTDDDPIDFESVVVGESATRTIVAENDAPQGGGDVTVDRVDIVTDPDDAYSLPDELEPETPGDPVATLAPGETLEIPVTVAPTAVGGTDGDLEIEYDNGISDTDEYELTATAVESMMDIEAVGPGEWGGRVAVTVSNSSRSNDTFDVTVRYWSHLEDAEGTDRERVLAQDEPDVEERFPELTTREQSSNYYETVIESGSHLIDVEQVGPDRPENGTRFLVLPPADDDTPDEFADVGLDEYVGDETAPRGERDGLAGFAEIDDISILTVPDENRVEGLTGEIVSHCERPNLQDRFAVLQAPAGANISDLPPSPAQSEYAALYYPQIEIIDTETGVQKQIPVGGHVAGIYARSDAEDGVWKAPANETVKGAVDLSVPVPKADQDRLNPRGVNAIRSFPERGIRVWGARTTSTNPQWTYVNVRRLFLYLAESIDEGTQWAVFESNTEDLWARVRQSVRNFLTTVWRNGGLAGSSPEEAFYVKADRTTMTQTEIDQGKLIVEIGVAPVKPAEFVIFRITQWTGGLEGGS